MPRDPRLYLDDILEATARIREYTKNIDFDEFTRNRMIQDAVGLPQIMKDEALEMEWRKITKLRNILAHEYFGVSLPIVWDAIQNKLDPLRETYTLLLKFPSGGQPRGT